jgi:DNA-binding SARP family transcriptional activator
MRIGLLGSLQVVGDSGVIAVTAARHRALLAALAIQAPNAVPAESLAVVLWDGHPPPGWKGALRTYAGRLHDILGAGAGFQIARRPAGRVLNISPDEVDVNAFEAQAKAGVAAAQFGDWRAAAEQLSGAEGLWRGEPFADVPSQVLRDRHAPYLSEALRTVQETRVEAEVRLSRLGADLALPRVRRLASQHPDSERLAMLLMLALYRAGRRSEALNAYRTTWAYLDEEHGVTPSPELAAMRQRIDHTDPALLAEPLLGPLWVPPAG